MIKLEIEVDDELKTFSLSESWDEVTVKQASQIFGLVRDGKNNLEIMVELISILANIDEDIVYSMQQDDFVKLVEAIKFTNEEIKSELKDSIILDGEEYFLKKDFEKLNVGEIISIETIMQQTGNDLSKSMSKLLCIFLRKKKENGKLEGFKNSFMEREELFEQAIITDVNNIFLFFLDGRNS